MKKILSLVLVLAVALSTVAFAIAPVDAAYEANVIMLPKGADELTAKVNEILAKAYAAGYYGEWYAEALELAGAETSVDVSYDDDGNVAG